MEWEERKKPKRCREKLSHHHWLPSSAFTFIFIFFLNIKIHFFKMHLGSWHIIFFDTYQQVLEQGLGERKGTKRDMLVETYFKLL